MKLRSFVITTLVALLLLMASAVTAQDMMDPCFGLSETDCADINNAYMALDGVNSFMMDYSINFSVTGLPESAGFTELTFNNSGTGALATDMTADFPVLMNLSMTTSATGPEAIPENTIEMRIVDGMLYMTNPETGEWGSINLMEAASDPSALGLPFDPEALASGDADALEAAGLDMSAMMGAMGSVMELMTVDGFLAYTRDGDVFTFTADIDTLLNAPEFTETLSTLAESSPDMAQLGMIGGMAPMLLQDGAITINQHLNPDLGAVDQIDFLTSLTINASAIDPEATEPIVIDLAFTVTISEPNGEFTFVAPENATPLDMGMGMGG